MLRDFIDEGFIIQCVDRLNFPWQFRNLINESIEQAQLLSSTRCITTKMMPMGYHHDRGYTHECHDQFPGGLVPGSDQW